MSFFSDFNRNLNTLTKYTYASETKKFMKIRPAETELFPTDRQIDTMKLITCVNARQDAISNKNK